MIPTTFARRRVDCAKRLPGNHAPDVSPARTCEFEFVNPAPHLPLAGRLWALLGLCLVAETATAREETADLRIRDVTVFSDRARIQRRGDVSLAAGVSHLRLPLLPPTLDPDSVRLSATGATVRLVEVKRADLDEFPRSEAEQLLKKLESLGDRKAFLNEQLQTLSSERALLEGLRPTATPQVDPKGQPRLFEPGGWRAAIDFLDSTEKALDAATVPLAASLRDVGKDLAQASERARQISSGTTAKPGFVVTADVEGRGRSAEITLSYIAMNARWRPAYDVRFAPGRNQVEIDFAGLVSQETGEDWPEARLVLSSAVPATATALPKLLAWKIGEKDQFIPTPQAKPEPVPPAPPVPPPTQVAPARTDEELRQALRAAVAGTPEEGAAEARLATEPAPAWPAGAAVLERPPPPARPPPPPPSPAPSRPQALHTVPAAQEEAFQDISLQVASLKETVRTESLAFTAPRGWTTSAVPADLPASQAGGYDFTFPAAKPETIHTGGEARRVALHASQFPAEPHLVILPALGKQAFLVADVTNASDRPLLQGTANLYFGADLQGQALLKTTAVGEKVTLPLGPDDAVRVERHVEVLTEEKGIFSKDDLTSYRVTIELMNPRSAAAHARVIDQIPLKGDQNVAVELLKTEPQAKVDKPEGTLEWAIDLPPGIKQTVTFTYSVRRPRGARLRQW